MRVAVVGGGVIGLFTSYYLLKGGARVVIFDIDPPGGRASEWNAGLITPSLSATPRLTISLVLRALLGLGGPIKVSLSKLLSRPGWFLKALRSSGKGDEVVRRLAEESLRLHLEFASSHGVDIDLVKGVVAAFYSREEAEKVSRVVRGRLLDKEGLERLGYVGFGGGVFIEEEISISPGKLYRALTEVILNLGGEIKRSRVAEVKPLPPGKWKIIAEGGDHECDSVVIAAGSRSGEICKSVGFDPGIEPARGLVMIYKTNERLVEAPALLEDLGIGVAQHNEETLRITGFFELVGHRTEWSISRIKWLEMKARKHVKRLYEAKPVARGMGFRPCSSDLLPLVGEIPGRRGLYIATGHCRLGVTMAPITGTLIASQILGYPNPIPSEITQAISPSRFSVYR